MATRRVPLSKEEVARIQGGANTILILGLVGLVFVIIGLAMIRFRLFDTIIGALPLFPGIFLIGYALKSYLDLKKNINQSYKDIVSGQIENMEIKYPSKFSSTKITYEMVGDKRVIVSEVSSTSKKVSTFDVYDDCHLREKSYKFYVTIESKEYSIPGLDFFALRKGDPIELEVLPSGEVLKLNRLTDNSPLG